MRRALIKVTGQSQALTHTAGSGRKLLLYSGKERSGSVTETSIDDECPSTGSFMAKWKKVNWLKSIKKRDFALPLSFLYIWVNEFSFLFFVSCKNKHKYQNAIL